MIDKKFIQDTVEEVLSGSDMFVVEVTVSPSSVVEVIIDSDTYVGIDACIDLSKKIEGRLDRDAEDFELTVMSSGVGQPLALLRQYKKIVGKEVEIVLRDGGKLVATLIDATDADISIEYKEKVAIEGKKRKEEIVVSKTILLSDIKSTKEYISFK